MIYLLDLMLICYNSQAGVCDGHCGLFVQGSYKDSAGKKVDCTATGYDLTNAVSQIQAFGCQTCGWVVTGESKLPLIYPQALFLRQTLMVYFQTRPATSRWTMSAVARCVILIAKEIEVW